MGDRRCEADRGADTGKGKGRTRCVRWGALCRGYVLGLGLLVGCDGARRRRETGPATLHRSGRVKVGWVVDAFRVL